MAIRMVKILLLLALAAIVLKRRVAAVDLYQKPEWHPCKTNFANQPDPHDFTPPNCVPVNHTITEDCEYFSCTTKLQESGEAVYFRIRRSSNYNTCLVPRLPPMFTILDMSTNWWYTIDADSFEEVSDLKFVGSLLLIDTTVGHTKQAFLEHLVNVECINIDRDIEHTFARFNIIHQLLSLPKLKYFSARYSRLTYKHIQNFSSIHSSSLQSLWLSHNEIGDGIPFLDRHSLTLPFYGFKNLTHLDLSYNEFREFNTLHDGSLQTLRTLDLSGNNLKQFPVLTCCDGGCPRSKARWGDSIWGDWHLSTLNLSDNKILYIELLGTKVCLPYLHVLDLSRNKLYSLNPTTFKGFIQNSRLENLQALVYDNTDLHSVEEDTFVDIFGNLTHLRTLSLSSRSMEFVSSTALAN
jgi:hypothetical protein